MYQFFVTISIIIPLALSSPVEYEPRGFMDVVKGIQNKTPTSGNCVAKCPWFQIYKFLPHDDCNKYCVCLSRFQFTVECQEGTYFSARHDTCVDPRESECGKVEGCLGQCPHESLKANVLLPHEDCNKYCHCRKGRPVPQDCAPNYQFNADRQRCLPLEQAECDRLNGFTTTTTESPTTTPSSPSPTNPSSPPSDSLPTTSESSSTTNLPESSPSTTASPSSTATPPTTSAPLPTTAPPTTSTPLPVTASEASTTENVKTTSEASTTPKAPTTENAKTTSQPLPTPSEPSADPLPEASTLVTVRTPSDRSVSSCAGHCPQTDDPDSVVLLAHKDCTKYCRCRGGRPVVKNCPPHYHFSLDQEMCLPSNYTTCHHLTHH